MNRMVLKSKAKEQLRGKWGYAALTAIILAAITSAAAAFPLIGPVIGLVITPVLTYGFISYNLQISRGKDVEISDLFVGFNRFPVVFVAGLLMSIFITLWSLLFIIPGIIATLKYSLTYYILIDNPDMTAVEAIDRSKEMTYGYKFDIFLLQLSFIGWGFLATFTCGIGYFWLVPYMNVTFSNLYDELKGDNSYNYH